MGLFATHYEPLLQFAEKATIAVIDQQFILFYDKSQANLLDMTTLNLKNVRVGAEMMYFENPYLLALDGTTFTKYDLDGNLLQRYTFKNVVRVVPDHQLDYHSHFTIHKILNMMDKFNMCRERLIICSAFYFSRLGKLSPQCCFS